MNTSRHVALAVIVAGLVPLVTTVSANAEIVRVEFAGTMDFSSIGGNASQPSSNLTVSVVGTTANFTWVPGSGGGAVANYVLVAGTTPGFAIPIASVTLPGAPGRRFQGCRPGRTTYAYSP
jgi:hypothetical protein